MNFTQRITLRQLEVFCEAARQPSFAAVANQLRLSTPAVSMQISQLEEATGLALFEKVGRRKQLTEAGHRLLEHAMRLFLELSDAEQSLLALKGLEGGSITVGLVSTANHFATRLLVAFSHQHPKVDVRFVVGNREALVQQLKNNQIDLAVMGRPPGEINCVAKTLAPNPHLVVAPAGHPLAGERHIDIQCLRQETFLQREPGSGTRILMDDLMRTLQFKPARLLTIGSNETVKQSVIAGLGLSILSLHTLKLELQVGELVHLDVLGSPFMHSWYVVNLRRRPLAPAALAFRKFLIDETHEELRKNYNGLVPAEFLLRANSAR